MKKVILYPFLALSAIMLQHCRPQDEVENDQRNHAVSKKAETDSAGSRSAQPVDPDPPVKDGQDWKHQ